jgi:hypothetical protein
MALNICGSKIYCYLPVRQDGRLTTEYLGSGQAALLARQHIDRERAKRRAYVKSRRRAVACEIGRLEREGLGVCRFAERVDELYRDAMRFGGFYLRKRQWRRRGTMRLRPGDPAFDDALRAERARLLFETAESVPALIEKLGGRLAMRVQEQLIERLTQDHIVREAVRREAEIMRQSLEGEQPTAIERLVVERIVIAWLNLTRLDSLHNVYADDLENSEVAAHVARMRHTANRDYPASLKALALIRRATPSFTVNISKTVNVN